MSNVPGVLAVSGSPVRRYAVALISIATVLVIAVTQLPSGTVSAAGLVQLAILVIAAVVKFLLPLVEGRWQGALKTAAAVFAAVLAAVLPLILQGGQLTYQQIAVVILAGLDALGTEVGVRLRTDDTIPPDDAGQGGAFVIEN